ncbi:hypothetical protein TWF694_003300 [Orbilia ellipsospora]|uniref:Uncharacterized protein n=1 Tax=Orbilia ellipsospora TaxID=2528407 RepID=A0AAV9X126_9PEZI
MPGGRKRKAAASSARSTPAKGEQPSTAGRGRPKKKVAVTVASASRAVADTPVATPAVAAVGDSDGTNSEDEWEAKVDKELDKMGALWEATLKQLEESQKKVRSLEKKVKEKDGELAELRVLKLLAFKEPDDKIEEDLDETEDEDSEDE